MGLIVFDPRTPARKGQLVLFTVGDQFVIQKLCTTIRVDAAQGKRKNDLAPVFWSVQRMENGTNRNVL
jgi:hypothetical protein